MMASYVAEEDKELRHGSNRRCKARLVAMSRGAAGANTTAQAGKSLKRLRQSSSARQERAGSDDGARLHGNLPRGSAS